MTRTAAIARWITRHGLPATVTPEGIQTEDRYTIRGQLHTEPVILPANFKAVNEFLGY